MKLEIIALILATSFLTSCGTPTTAGDKGYAVPVYSQSERRAVVTEMRSCPAPQTLEFLKDYKVLRDQTRVGE